MEQLTQANNFKAGYVAIVGQPNVGKSTLVNALLQFDLSIITAKPQTTRNRILGIHTGENFQIIFWDTPGLLQPHYKLHEMMMKAARTAMLDADIILFLVDAVARDQKRDFELLKELAELAKPVVLAINKVDLLEKSQLLPLMDQFRQGYVFADIVPVSALKKLNIADLENTLIKMLPKGRPFYPEDYLTEHPERFFVSEIIREKIFISYGEEIPYSTAVIIDNYRERPGAKDLIQARIVVERNSQKGIVIGKGGKALQKLGKMARESIEEFLQRPVFLELHVVVRDKWRQKEVFLKEFGYNQ
jgi:GTPase